MKKVPLTKGYFALIDNEDYKRVSKYKWQASVSKEGRVCALHSYWSGPRPNRKSHKLLMHRFITDVLDAIEVDHRNGNALDNRKSNLRVTDCSGNRRNRPVRSDSKSRLKGVQLREAGNWRARIRVGGKMTHLGTFGTKKKAALAYDKAAKELHGDFARPNFGGGRWR